MGSKIIYRSYANKHQKHVACSYGYELVCVDNKFSKPFKSYFREDAVYNFTDSMIKESKCCSEMMRKPFNKELEMTKKHNEDFKNSSKCLFCDKNYVDVGVKVKDHCQVTGKYRSSVYRDCNINVKSNNKILIDKNFDFHVIMQELDKFNLKINVILNGLAKYMSFNISKKLIFVF